MRRLSAREAVVFLMLLVLVMSGWAQAPPPSTVELVFDQESYSLDAKTRIFSLRDRAVSQDLQKRLTALFEHMFPDEKIVSLNPVSIQNRLYYPFIYYDGEHSREANDCVTGQNIFSIQTPQTSFRFKGFIALDERMQAVTGCDILRDIVESFFFQYGFSCPNSSLGESSKYQLGWYDRVSGGGASVGKHDEEFIKNLTEHLLSIIPLTSPMIKEQFQALLEGGAEHQSYQKILHHLLIVNMRDVESQEKKEIFDKVIAGDFDAKNYLRGADAETAAKLEMYENFIEELKKDLVFIQDMVTGDYRVSSTDGKIPSIIWQQEFTDLLFSLAEEKTKMEYRLDLMKSLIDVSKEYPSVQFNLELLSAVQDVIQEAESMSVDYIIGEYDRFLLEKGKDFMVNHSRTFIEKAWDSFVLQHTPASSLRQKFFLGAVGKTLHGHAVSDRLEGEAAVYELAIRARAEIGFMVQLKEALSLMTQPVDKYQRSYLAQNAQHIKTLLIFLGLSRADFHHDMANIAASSGLTTWIADMWQSFFGQTTMTDAIYERKKIAKESEDNFVKHYTSNPNVKALLESVRGFVGQAKGSQSGSALTLAIDSRTSAAAAQETPPDMSGERMKLGEAGRVDIRKTSVPDANHFDIPVEDRTLSGKEFQRQNLKRIYMDEDSDSNGIVTKTWGGYVEINIGHERGLVEGTKILMFSFESKGLTKVAEGFVTAAYQGRSIVELDAGFGSAIPKVGDRVEIETSER